MKYSGRRNRRKRGGAAERLRREEEKAGERGDRDKRYCKRREDEVKER